MEIKSNVPVKARRFIVAENKRYIIGDKVRIITDHEYNGKIHDISPYAITLDYCGLYNLKVIFFDQINSIRRI